MKDYYEEITMNNNYCIFCFQLTYNLSRNKSIFFLTSFQRITINYVSKIMYKRVRKNRTLIQEHQKPSIYTGHIHQVNTSVCIYRRLDQ